MGAHKFSTTQKKVGRKQKTLKLLPCTVSSALLLRLRQVQLRQLFASSELVWQVKRVFDSV